MPNRSGVTSRTCPVGWSLLACTLGTLAACSDAGRTPAAPPGPEAGAPDPTILALGERLFERETFGGNGRTCRTCHMPGTGTITVEAVAARLAGGSGDELLRHDGLDDGATGTRRIASHATIRIELPLPPNISLADEPARRTIVVNRGVPSTLNAPAFAAGLLMLDLRSASLREQALDAIRTHALAAEEPSEAALEAIAAFQQRDPRFFSSQALFEFSGGTAPPPALPAGESAAERRGRLAFVSGPVRSGHIEGVCALCHSGAMLNEVNSHLAAATGFRVGQRFVSVLVAEANATGNYVYRFRVDDGTGDVRSVAIADPGIMVGGLRHSHVLASLPPGTHPVELAGFFKTPSLWGVPHTPPYFHDNSAKSLRAVVDHYADVFFPRFPINGEILTLSESDRQAIVAFLERL